MDTENCYRCAPKLVPAMGFIPMPEPSNIGDSRFDEQRIPLCSTHYFEAKQNCYYVVPFDRDDDPVDSFLSRVNRKHKQIRGSLKLKYGLDKDAPRASKTGKERFPIETTPSHPITNVGDEVIILHNENGSESERLKTPQLLPPRTNQTSHNIKYKFHHPDGNQTVCGLPVVSVACTTEEDMLTCKNCINLLVGRETEYAENTSMRK